LSQVPFERVYGRAEQYIDVTADTAVTSGTAFIPSSPPAEPGSNKRESNWTKQDIADFDEYLCIKKPRFILTAEQRMTFRHYLQNPNMAPRGDGTARQDDRNAKHTALTNFEL
jgi:hypothetical protein